MPAKLRLPMNAVCPDADKHYPCEGPEGYLARQAWFKEMAKTHKQKRCEACGYYKIWVPK